MKPIDMSSKRWPSASYRWGVAPERAQHVTLPPIAVAAPIKMEGDYHIGAWFKTRRAAEAFAHHVTGPHAIARWL